MSNTKIDSKYKTMFSDYPDVVTVAPVSYTHLAFRLQQEYVKNDVVLYTVNGETHIGRVIARETDVVTLDDSGTLLVNGTAPVSYTHLDVYKRQVGKLIPQESGQCLCFFYCVHDHTRASSLCKSRRQQMRESVLLRKGQDVYKRQPQDCSGAASRNNKVAIIRLRFP